MVWPVWVRDYLLIQTQTKKYTAIWRRIYEASDIWLGAKNFIAEIVAAVNIFVTQIFKFNTKQLI